MKFPHQREIIKIMGDEPIEAEAHLMAVPTTTPALSLTPSRKDQVAKVVDSVK